MITHAIKSALPDDGDEGALRHGRERHFGYAVGRYLQAPAFFFTRDKWPVPLVDIYRGHAAFLIASGPSFTSFDHATLREPGILTMGMNNSVKTFRPNLWTCVDDPASFIRSTWLDPTIQKFVPISHIEKPLFNSDTWKFMDVKVGDCPNVVFYKRNERFNAEQYLWEDTINWGNHTKMGGGRSVLLAAVRILFLLGVRTLFLLGVDLEMSPESKYHFEQDRSAGSIRGNNSTYRMLQERFTQLRPHFEAAGLQVYNCNPETKLTAFDFMPFEEALILARHPSFPADVRAERTVGLYDRKSNEKKKPKRPAQGTLPLVSHPPPVHLGQIKKQVDEARMILHAAKAATDLYRKQPSFDQAKLDELVKAEGAARKVFRRLVAVREQAAGAK